MLRVLPHNIEAEKNYLGCLINDCTLIKETILGIQDFYLIEHQKIFEHIIKQDGVYDLITLSEKLERLYLVDLASHAGIQHEEYQRIIKRKSNLRILIAKFEELSTWCYQEEDLDKIVVEADKLSSSIETDSKIKILPLLSARALLNQKSNRKCYYSTGYEFIDKYLTPLGEHVGGFGTGDLVILSGQTGHGKTSFSQELTYKLAIQSVSSLWFSYEINPQTLVSKFEHMGIDDDCLVYMPFNNKLTLSSRLKWIKDATLEAIKQHDIKAIFVDHLGFLSPEVTDLDRNLSANYSTYLSHICRSLKTFAVENNIMVFLMAHIGKKAEDAEPTTNDLRDSSGIAQEADLVIMIQRELNKNQGPNDPDYYTPMTKILFTKNRTGGRTFSTWARFNEGHYLLESNYQSNSAFKRF